MSSNTKAGGWGKPKYGQSTGQKTGKPKEGDNFIRILPPMHSLAEQGLWAFYETTHWGFHGVNAADPSKPFPRPVRCVQVKDRRTQMISVPCAACERFDKEDEAAKARAAELKASGLSDDEIATEMHTTEQWLKENRPERRWYVNVMYKDGTFGNYKLNHKFHMAALRVLTDGPKSLQVLEGIDPLDLDQGVWFNVCRVGKGIGVVDTIQVEKEDVTPPGATRKTFQTALAPLTEEQATRALTECVDLPTLGGMTITPEQMEQLVNCTGEPEEVDRILGIDGQSKTAAKVAVRAPVARTSPATQEASKPAAVAPATKTAPPAAVASKPASKPASSANADAMAKRMADIKAKQEAERVRKQAEDAAKAAAEAAAAENAAEAANAAKENEVDTASAEPDPMSMSDEEFTEFFNKQDKE